MNNQKQVALTLGMMCLVLTIGICIQIRTISSTNSTVTQTLKEDGLRDDVLRWKERYDNRYRELEDRQKDLEKIREVAAADDTTTTTKEEQIKQNNMILGVTDVTGSGLIFTLKDNQTVTAEMITSIDDDISYYLVHDSDLRMVVNELKNAGAEAISINDQRIVSTSAITCEGNIIKINGEKIGSPFTIKAIGSPELLYGALTRPGGPIELFNSKVITDIKKSNTVEIKKYTGVINAKYMEPAQD